jgi:hypothetical protein
MSLTKISWADRVWNPLLGCTRISDGCSGNHGPIATPKTDAQVLTFGIQQGMAAEVAHQIRAEFGLDQVDCAPKATEGGADR